MFARRTTRAAAVAAAALACGIGSLALAGTAYAGGPPNGSIISNAAQAQAPFSAGTFDSGQPIDVVVPANSSLVPNGKVFILECSAPNGVVPTTINSCDGNTAYSGGTITANSDGSVDVINSSSNSGLPYTVYALPDLVSLGEPSSALPKCGLGSANECVLYIGQGGGSDTGLSAPHFFSQPFQVHPDATDSGTLNPGDGTFGADAAPGAISTANHATFTKGTSGTFSIAATGYGPPAFTETGTLPAGVSLKTTYSGLTSTGVLSGTPTQTGTFPITITASNGVGTPTTQNFTLTVQSAPVFTSVNHYTFTQGTAPSFSFTATGFPAPTFSVTAGSIDGLSLNATTGALTGTPTATGTFTSTITASNGANPAATQSFTLTVASAGTPPVITSAASTSFTNNTADSFQVTATGTPAPTFTETGTLPAGVTLSTSGLLSGTPTVSGIYPITITASNGISPAATQSFTLTVGFVVTTTSLPDAVVGTAYSQQLAVAGGGTATVSWKKVLLPKGFALSSTGLLTGTPSAKATGDLSVKVTATDGKKGAVASATIPLTVNEAPAFGKKSPIAAGFTEGTLDTATLTATGFPAPTFTTTTPLPSGVTLSSAGVLSGTPAVTTNSSLTAITIVASNGVSPAATETFNLSVYAPLVVTTTSLTGTHGVAFSQQLTATGGAVPGTTAYSWKKKSLPKGFALSSTGLLTASAPAATNTTIQVTVTSAEGKTKVTVTQTISLVIS